MYKVAVIGDKDSILAFKALGVEVYTAIDGTDAKKTIKDLAKKEFGVIFITCLLYTSPSPRDGLLSRMPSSA